MKHFFVTLVLLSFQMISQANSNINYTLSFPEPQTHYVQVQMEISAINGDFVDLKMPVWTPGSYLVREFARHVEAFDAKSGNTNLTFEKTNKNTWRINTKGLKSISVNYKVYAFELTVRTSFVDAAHAYINGASVFMYVAGRQNDASDIKIVPSKDWKVISNSLDKVGEDAWVRTAPNYDILADSPFEIGNHEVIAFTAAGIPHEIAMYGRAPYDKEKIVKDFTKIIETEKGIFDEHPCQHYVFIVHNLVAGGGGLEHLNSTTLQTNRNSYTTEAGYNGFLSLAAHEYFHLWNVKRLRPDVLGPFDYDNENYTTQLWISEGFTAFYDEWVTRRAGFYTETKYQESIAGVLSLLANTPGNLVQSASESSFDAWIKYYRRNENSNNSGVSYYDKGALLGMLLNLEILQGSNGKYTLDEAMKRAYNKYYVKAKRGFTEKEFKTVLEEVAGKNLDDFYTKYIHGTELPNLDKYFDIIGVKITNTNEASKDVWLGANTTSTNGRTVISSVVKGACAYTYGLNANDEIIAIDGYRIDDLAKFLSTRKVGESLDFVISRDGVLQTVKVKLGNNTTVKYKLEKIEKPSNAQSTAYEKWIGVK